MKPGKILAATAQAYGKTAILALEEIDRLFMEGEKPNAGKR